MDSVSQFVFVGRVADGYAAPDNDSDRRNGAASPRVF